MIRTFQLKALFFFFVIGALFSACTTFNETPEPPVAYMPVPLNGVYYELDVDSTLLLEPQITYDFNSVYEWSLNGVVIPNSNSKVMKVNPALLSNRFGTFNYVFKVTNDNGTFTKPITVVTLRKVDFEEFKLKSNIDSIGITGASGQAVIKTKLLSFPVALKYVHRSVPPSSTIAVVDTVNWNGFVLSNKYSSSPLPYSGQFSALSSSGGDERSKNFLVFHDDQSGVSQFITFTDGKNHLVGQIALANSAYTYGILKNSTFLNGDTVHSLAEKKGFFGVRITGYTALGVVTDSIDFNLGDYRFNSSLKNFIFMNWVTLDLNSGITINSDPNLTSLGSINKIGFRFISSEVIGSHVKYPTYFCIDNIRILD